MSDQDFFFDEDENAEQKSDAAPAKQTAPKKPSSSGSGKASAQPAQTVQTVSMTVAALIGVVALLLGVIIGIVIPTGGDSTPAPTATTGGVSAPQLSPEQLESGAMPEGHPDVGGAAPDGSAPATEAP